MPDRSRTQPNPEPEQVLGPGGPNRSRTPKPPTTRQRVGTGGPNRSGTPITAAAKRQPTNPNNPPQSLQLDPFNKKYKEKEYGSILRSPIA